MMLTQLGTFLLLLLVKVTSSRSFTSDLLAVDAAPVNQIANITYGVENENHGSLTSIFSPRMDFEQWKPLTGRGDPLRNDPTYDYEPPVLDRVHYWADDTRLEREHFPERKSEVLMLGVSSRKPSITSRQPPLPPLPPRRHVHRPQPNKYEDFTYKLSDHYPMTILVPPPPPPPGHQALLFVLSDDTLSNTDKKQSKIVPSSKVPITDSTAVPEHLSSFYALQESNLIYQSSTTENWITKANETKTIAHNAVSSDYAGWGPTTPVDDRDVANDTHNFISNDHLELSNHPYSFYKPMLSEAPPPPKKTYSPLVLPTFLPTVLPPTTISETSTQAAFTQVTWPTERTTELLEVPTEIPQEETTEQKNLVIIQQTPIPTTMTKTETSIFDMLKPMMSMPMVNGPERPEDNLYAHASENIQIFNEHNTEDIQIQSMLTMQPPPPIKQSESSTLSQFHVNSQVSNKNPALYTHGPYLHGRFTTPIPTTIDEFSDNIKSTTEMPPLPMYLIIQGHSKVKTYGSKPKIPEKKNTISNEISKPSETNEVKHLHPITKKSAKKIDLTNVNRKAKAKNLKALIDRGLGSIEIQETDLGIKYDVSDGSDVPVEIYRKGIVDNDEHDYSLGKKNTGEIRSKRQIDLEDLLPFDEDDIEEYVYNFLESKKNETSIAGLIAQAVTSDTASAVDELENDDDILEEER